MLEAGYWDNEKERGSVVRDRLSKARDKHHQMSTSSVGNLQAAEVCRKVRETNKQMQGEIQALNKRLLAIQTRNKQPIERERREIYTQWRRIEQQAETLKFLAQIANLKLNSSGITRRVNDTQANQLKNAFLKIDFNDFRKARGTVSDALSLNSTPKVHPNA